MRSEKVRLPLHQSPLRQMNQTHLSSLLQSTIDTSVMTPRSLINPDNTDIWELNVELLSKQQLVLMALLIMWEWDITKRFIYNLVCITNSVCVLDTSKLLKRSIKLLHRNKVINDREINNRTHRHTASYCARAAILKHTYRTHPITLNVFENHASFLEDTPSRLIWELNINETYARSVFQPFRSGLLQCTYLFRGMADKYYLGYWIKYFDPSLNNHKSTCRVPIISIHSRPVICEWKSNGALISRKTALLLTVQERVSERSRDTGRRAQSVFRSSSPPAVKTDAVHDTRYTGHRDTRAQGESELQKHEAVTMSKKWNNI